MCFNILGVKIDNLNKSEILERIDTFLSEDKFHQIATVNPEFVLKAQKDKKYRNILNECALNIIDGVGLQLACKISRNPAKSLRSRGAGSKLETRNYNDLYLKNKIFRFAGVDLMEELLKKANQKKLAVFWVVNKNGLSKYADIKKVIKKKYPKIKILGKDMDCRRDEALPRLYKANISQADIIFCNFGVVKQEKFLYNLRKYSNLKIAVGLGGSFDFLTGVIPRAPKNIRHLGLEWLWRFSVRPKRFRKVLDSILVFPYCLFLAYLKQNLGLQKTAIDKKKKV